MSSEQPKRSDPKASAETPRRKRAKWGAVIEAEFAVGYRYIHWVGASWHCDLIRVLPGLFSAPLTESDLERLVGGVEEYKMQVFLRDVLRESNVRVVHHVAPTAAQQVIPAFRISPRAIEGNPDSWRLIDEYAGPQPPPNDPLTSYRISGAEYAERHPQTDRRQITPWAIPLQDTFLHMLEIDWRPEQATEADIYGWNRERPQVT